MDIPLIPGEAFAPPRILCKNFLLSNPVECVIVSSGYYGTYLCLLAVFSLSFYAVSNKHREGFRHEPNRKELHRLISQRKNCLRRHSGRTGPAPKPHHQRNDRTGRGYGHRDQPRKALLESRRSLRLSVRFAKPTASVIVRLLAKTSSFALPRV